ncbi:HlyD family secretion protein [Neptunomonas antarctica]|uniref:HlyD family secretion protein n=1 Tax=Neptunomonas antarctica TaxID=619304 RepID=A0A1N7LZ91_9GAMM|nr:HlyD family efflux transporter periplasmic adaptor subunit [Neptunomonas antarctica]SIS79133.1 HlyD family secretion protein [Neptunomonas antarctica]
MSLRIGCCKGNVDVRPSGFITAAFNYLVMLSILLLVSLTTGCSEDAPRVFGTVDRDRLTLTSPVAERVATVNVSEGEIVKAGDVLLTLDSTAENARVAQYKAELAEENAKLAELVKGARIEDIGRAQAVVAGAQATLKEAEQRFERTQRLYKTKVLTQADLDAAIVARDTAIAKQTEAQQSLKALQNGTRSEQLDQARAAVDIVRAKLAGEYKALSDLNMSVAQDAVVDILPWHVGDRVAAGTQLVSLLAINNPYVRVYLPATWLDRVKPGSVVNVWVDGRSTAIKGVVRNIRSQPAYTPFYALNERDRARLMYLTDIDLPEADKDLHTGMALEVGLPE